jgi:hypothetical protein
MLVIQDIGLFLEDDPTCGPICRAERDLADVLATTSPSAIPKRRRDVPTTLRAASPPAIASCAIVSPTARRSSRKSRSAKPTKPKSTDLKAPRFTLAPGEVVRFRMLNACSDNYMPITVEGHDMYLLALDGVNFPKVRVIPPTPINTDPSNEGQIQLAPANRAEFMIKGAASPASTGSCSCNTAAIPVQRAKDHRRDRNKGRASHHGAANQNCRSRPANIR